MAIDSRAKRASVPGVGRPWYRTKQPAAISVTWRASSGNAYATSEELGAATLIYYFKPRLGTFGRLNQLP